MWKLSFRNNSSLFDSARYYHQLFLGSFVFFTLVHVGLLLFSPLGLAPDEAQYWDWSRTLDWAYFSKGPVVAVLIYLSRAIFGDTVWAIRFPALLLFSLFSWIFYQFSRRRFGERVALIGFLLLRTLPVFISQAFVLTTDTPVALFWLLALIYFYAAIIENKGPSWLIAFAFLGLATLSKYTALIMLPTLLGFACCDRKLRPRLCDKWFYVGLILLGGMLLPIFLWNREYGWVNMAHNLGHLVPSQGFGLRPQFVLELIGGQMGLFNPVLFVSLLWSLWWSYKKWRSGASVVGFYWAMSFPLLLLCLFVSLSRRVYANWPMPSYIGGLMLLMYLLKELEFYQQKTKNALKAVFVINAISFVLIVVFALGFTFGLPGKILPTKTLVGWDSLGAFADRIYEAQAAHKPEPLIITDNYGYAAELSFYMKNKPIVFCAPVGGRRANQYDIWGFSKKEEFKSRNWSGQEGKNAVILLKDEVNAAEFKKWFKSVKKLAGPTEYKIMYGGAEIRRLSSYYGENFLGLE